jgi:hypothetical protein
MVDIASAEAFATPAHRVVARLGGVGATAEIAEASPKSVYRWLQPMSKGGGGGLIPLPAQRRMVNNAAHLGQSLSFADFAPQPGERVLA